MLTRMRSLKAFAISICLPLAASALLLPNDRISRAMDDPFDPLLKRSGVNQYVGDLFGKRQSSSNQSTGAFSWNDLKPAKTLVWKNCYGSFQCARLIVPLNYSEPNGKEAVIAMIRVPSPLGPGNGTYRGPVLFNPGGPGGSGVDFILEAGHAFSTLLGPQFDIIGFDPRGVSRSTPRASFFKNSIERALYAQATDTILNETTGSLGREWARAKVVGQLANQYQHDAIGHLNTDQTARDMLSIIRAHGKEKLLYWGFSYGSVLGATFASMFPNNVERLVVDGVVDIEDYYKTLWSTNLIDTDKTMNWFYTSCHDSGPEKCPFYAPTPELIEANLTTLYNTVRTRPVAFHNATAYGIVDYDFLRNTVFSSLYAPYGLWPTLARSLADLANGNASSLFGMSEALEYSCGEEDVNTKNNAEALRAVACNDGDPVSESYEDLEKYYRDTSSKSSWAEVWDAIRTGCVGWPKLSQGFRGPFKAKTSYPMLFVGNTADPVTPLAAAKKTAEGFEGAVVLTQDSPGHASVAAPSVCTSGYIRAYFVNGTLPAPGTVCPIIGTPFDPSTNTTGTQGKEVRRQLSGPDSGDLWDVTRKLSEKQIIRKFSM